MFTISLIIATSGTDLMSGEHENVISDYEGTATLAPIRNLIPDPGFEKSQEKDGTLKYWDLGESPKPTHWTVFAKDGKTQKNYGRQIAGQISLNKEMYNIVDALVPGSGPISSKDTIDIARPLRPKAKAYLVSKNVGFPAGWYCLAMGWIIGKKFKKFQDGNKNMTGPGPRSEPFYLAQGNGFYVIVPSDSTEGITGVAYYLTQPSKTEIGALSSKLFVQSKEDLETRSGIYKFYGPLDVRFKDDGKNNSSPHKKRKASFRKKKSNQGKNKTLKTTDIVTGFKLVTSIGSTPSNISTESNSIDELGETVFAFQPEEYGEEVIGWVPEIYTKDEETGQVTKFVVSKDIYAGAGRKRRKSGSLPYFPVGEEAEVFCTDPILWPASSGTSLVENDDLEDYNSALVGMEEEEEGIFSAQFPDAEEQTDPMANYTPTDSSLGSTEDPAAIEAPTEAPTPVIVLLNNSGLTPGKHHIKTALFVEDEEGSESPPTNVNVGMGDGIKISRPKWHNKLSNDDLGSRDVDNKPVEWDFLDVAVNYLPEKKGVIQLSEEGSPTSDADLFVTPPAELNPEYDRYTLTMGFHYTKNTTGAIDVVVEEYDENDALLSTQRVSRFGRRSEGRNVQQNYKLSQRVTDVASPSVTKLSPNATYIRARVKGVGSRSRLGGRNHIVRMSDFAAYEGWSVPKTIDINLETQKKTGDAPGPGKNTKDEDHNKFSRPHGGYCVVRTDPKGRPYTGEYVMRDFTIFETGTNEGWIKNVSEFDTLLNDIRKEAALFSEYGVHMSGTGGGSSDSRTNYVKKVFNPETTMTVSWDMFIKTFNEQDISLGAIMDAQDKLLALVTLTRFGSVLLYYNTPTGLSEPVTALSGLDVGMQVHFKLSLNVLSGKVTLFFGSDEDDVDEVATIEGIDYSQFGYAVAAILGPSIPGFAVNRFAEFDLSYGKIEITNLGDWNNVRRDMGNYIEYYGPRGTPRNGKYGPTGMRVPVKEEFTYTLGVSTTYTDMSKNSYLFAFRAMSEDHRVLRTFNPLVPDIEGNQKGWKRDTKTFTTPPGTAYIEFHSNKLGQGILRIHGLQLEEGTVATPFNMEMSRSGWFNIYFNNAQGEVYEDDPMVELGRVKSLRNVMVSGTDTDYVSYMARYRSGDSLEELATTPYSYDYAKLNTRKKITEVRIDLASAKDYNTPEINYVELDVERPYAQLLKEDGTEYRGGVNVYEIQTPSAPPNLEISDLASGGKHFDEWGYERARRIACKLRSFRRSTSEAIMSSYKHVLEFDSKRVTVWTDEPISFSSNVGTRIYFNDGREYFQLEEADFEGYVMSEEELI